MNYAETCFAAAKRQMPSVPAGLIDSLPLEDSSEGNLYLHQSGGFCMVIACGDRALTQDGAFFVGDSREGMEAVTYYEGSSFGDALQALLA